MAAPERDLPLAATPASRFMTWVTGALVYLAILAFALAAVSDGRVNAAAREPRMLSVSLPPANDPETGRIETERVLAELRALPGVAFAQPISANEMSELVEPWLGSMADLANLPLPRLIDVAYNPGVEPDTLGVLARLAAVTQGVAVETVPTPLAEIARTARILRVIGGGLGVLLLLVGMVVVAVVTRLSLDLHDETVDLLRLMGAADSYVARQFEQHALSSGLRGGLTGFLLASLTLVGTAWGLGHLADIPTHDLRPVDWVLLACVPVVGVLAATLTARIAASTGLARLR
jgi:cell division transport system permease protein